MTYTEHPACGSSIINVYQSVLQASLVHPENVNTIALASPTTAAPVQFSRLYSLLRPIQLVDIDDLMFGFLRSTFSLAITQEVHLHIPAPEHLLNHENHLSSTNNPQVYSSHS